MQMNTKLSTKHAASQTVLFPVMAATPSRCFAVLLLVSSVLLILVQTGPAAAQMCTTSSPAVTVFTGTLDDLTTDCNTLLELKDELDTKGKLNWTAEGAMSTWDGVTVTGTPPRVTELNLHNNKLTGTIPATLKNLTNLVWLYLSANNLSGAIPNELGRLPNLRYLVLSDNQLRGGIPDLSMSTKLVWLYLNSNRLTDTIPPTLGALRSLQVLSLHSNQLTGTIPQTLANLENLEELALNNNEKLTGPIPEAWSTTKLRTFALYATNWTGEIPQALKDKPGLLLQTNRRPIPNSEGPPILRVGEASTYEVFTDPDGDTLACDATRADGSAFPRWLNVDGTEGRCTLRVRADAAAGELAVKVRVTDTPQDESPALKAFTTLTLIVDDVPPLDDDPGDDTDNPGDGNPGDDTDNPGDDTDNPGDGNPGDGTDNPGDGNPGDTGDTDNTGDTGNPGNTGTTNTGTPGGGPGGDDPQSDDTTSAEPTGYLENPGADSFQSGIGVISGWVCEAESVEVEIETAGGEVTRLEAAYGTARLDTAALPDGTPLCGDTDNGFGVLFNWNRLGAGEHTVVALVDGVELGRATVTVTTVGAGAEEEFLRGAEGECVVADFPMLGETVTLEWQQNSQNFVITDVE